jgi:ABC-2 type transport system ATP-binding protein
MSGRAALEADHISKQFGSLLAVSDLSLMVNEGDIYGFIGPNGAGKTTSIRMMLGLIEPSAGTARVFGRDIHREFKVAIRHVGALVEGPAFYPYMSGRRNLRLFGRLSGGVSEGRIKEVLKIVGLGRRGDDKVKGFSQGMRQRLGIALALLTRPRLLVLDEPTNGLDPQGTREVRNLIRRIRDEEGTTVFLSSHLLSEMEMICDRIGIIYRGKIIKEGRMNDLIGSGSDVVKVQVGEDQDRQCRDFLAGKFSVAAECTKRGVIEFPKKDLDLFPINQALMGAGFKVSSISARHRSLEEFFVDLTGESQDVY